MSDIGSLLSELGIDAKPIEGPELALVGRVYTLRPSSEAEQDAWIERLSSRPGVVALAVNDPLDWTMLGERLPSSDEVEALSNEAARLLREMDAATKGEQAPSPDRVRGIKEWARDNPEGAPLSSLMDAIASAPVAEVAPRVREIPPDEGEPEYDQRGPAIAVVLTSEDPSAILAAIGFGHFNSCPPTPYHVAALRRWGRDHAAKLIALGSDLYELEIGRPPANDAEHLRLIDEMSLLRADDSPDPGALRRLKRWFFWWD